MLQGRSPIVLAILGQHVGPLRAEVPHLAADTQRLRMTLYARRVSIILLSDSIIRIRVHVRVAARRLVPSVV